MDNQSPKTKEELFSEAWDRNLSGSRFLRWNYKFLGCSFKGLMILAVVVGLLLGFLRSCGAS